MLNTLIDKQDNFQLIGAKIAAILAAECVNQMALADAADKDTTLWSFRVFHEASSIAEEFTEEDKTPIVNVWFESNSTDGGSSNAVERQTTEGVYNIDCYGYGVSSSTDSGHDPGDKAASLEAQRIACLVRNIVMSNVYTYLEMRGTVGKRWASGLSMFHPTGANDVPVEGVVGARLRLEVTHNEFSTQGTPETIESISLNIRRKGTGEIYINSVFDYS